MKAQDRSTQLRLREGESVEVSLKSLRQAASVTERDSTGLLKIVVDGKRVSLLHVFGRAAGLPTDAFTVAEASRAARDLGFSLVDSEPATQAHVPPIDLKSELARRQGEWVAVSDDRVIGSDADLAVLLEQTTGTRATVFFVARRSGTTR